MTRGMIAKASVIVRRNRTEVWDALINPKVIKQYMFGTNVVSDWREKSSIRWRGV